MPRYLFCGNTDIPVRRSILDISGILLRAGAFDIHQTFDVKTREPTGLAFTLEIDGCRLPFRLPARSAAIYRRIHGNDWRRDAVRDLEQAKRTAWRQLYRWIQAQVALIDSGMVTPGEAFFAYLRVSVEETVYERALTRGIGRLALPEGLKNISEGG